MTPARWSHVAAAVAGAVAGATLMLAASGMSQEQGPHPGRGAPLPSAADAGDDDSTPDDAGAGAPGAYVVWSPGGLPAGTGMAVRGLPGTTRVTAVRAGLDWIVAEATRDRARAPVRPRGYAIPWEVAIVRPGPYAHFVPPAERDAILALRRGEVLLAETSARLRGDVSHIILRDRSVRVAGVVSDAATNGYEAIMRGPVPDSWARVDDFLLVSGRRIDRSRLTRRLDAMLPEGSGLVVRARGENPFLRYGDAVLPQLIIKDVFGEFSARPRPDGYLDIDPAWRKANIKTAPIPVLGDVTCHRVLFRQMRAAFRSLVAENLAPFVYPRDFGGCFSPRFINLNPDGRISHHSWGMAFDVNVSENAFATEPDLNPRVVEHIESWGFSWGGGWLIPDGMHFEWTRFP